MDWVSRGLLLEKKYLIKLNIREILLAVGMVCHAVIYKYYFPGFSPTLTLSLAVIPILFFVRQTTAQRDGRRIFI